MGYFFDAMQNGFSALLHYYLDIHASDFDNITYSLEEDDLVMEDAHQEFSRHSAQLVSVSCKPIYANFEDFQESSIAPAEAAQTDAHWLRI